MSDSDEGIDGLPSPKELRSRKAKAAADEAKRQEALDDAASPKSAMLSTPPPVGAGAPLGKPPLSPDSSNSMITPPGTRPAAKSILKPATPSGSFSGSSFANRRSVSFVVPSPSNAVPSGSGSRFPQSPPRPAGKTSSGGSSMALSPPEDGFTGFSFAAATAPLAAGQVEDRQTGLARAASDTTVSDATSTATGSPGGSPARTEAERQRRLSESNLHAFDEAARPRLAAVPTATTETSVTTEDRRGADGTSFATTTLSTEDDDTVRGEERLQMQSPEAAEHGSQSPRPEGDDGEGLPEDSIAKKRRKKKGKVHPLLQLPPQPWRIKLRSFFFPALHRKVLALQDKPVPLKEPLFGDWFEHLMVIAILFNIVILALFDPFRSSESTTSQLVFTSQVVITFVFQFELFIRGAATGFRRMLNPLRLLDAAVIALCTGALIAQLAGTDNRLFGISVLRTPRLLRPLNNLGALPAVMILVDSLSKCVVKIGDVSTLFVSFLLIFAVASVGMFKGVLRQRCVNDAYFNMSVYNFTELAPNVTFTGAPDQFVCGGLFDEITSAAGQLGCSPDQLCDTGERSTLGMTGYRCPWGYTCERVGNPVAGFVGFDNIAMSFLVLFVSSSQQMWFQVAGDTADATDSIAYFYLAAYVMIAILLFNLMIVIITVDFDLARQRAQQSYLEGGQQRSKFQDLVSELIKQKRAAEEAMANVAAGDKDETSDNVAVAMAQKTFDETTKAVGKVRALTFKYIVSTTWFFYVVVGLIVVNVIALAAVHYNMDSTLEQVLEYINFVLLIAFSAESVLRFTALSFHEFIADKMNIFDLIINAFGWVDFLVGGSSLAFLRAFRVIRALKLLKLSPGVYHWIGFILASVKSSPVILLLIFFVTLLFALMCMQLLGGHLCGLEPDSGDNADCFGRPRYNFDDFGHAMITAFQVITGDNWNDVMYVAMESQGAAMGVLFSLYFYFGNFILLSLFVGILLSARADDAATTTTAAAAAVPAAAPKPETKSSPGSSRPGSPRPASGAASPRPSPAGAGAGLPPGTDGSNGDGAAKAEGDQEEVVPMAAEDKKKLDVMSTVLEGGFQSTAMLMLEQKRGRKREPSMIKNDDGTTTAKPGGFRGGFSQLVSLVASANVNVEQFSDEEDEVDEAEIKRAEEEEAEAARTGTTRRQLRAREKMRQSGRDSFIAADYKPTQFEVAIDRSAEILRIVLSNIAFHVLTAFVVVAASVAMGVKDPIAAPDLPVVQAVDIIDTIAKAYFIFETSLQIFAFGFVRGKQSFVRRDKWNIFDLFMSLLGFVLLIMKQTSAGRTMTYRVMNTIMALRPLSLVRYSTSMNLVARALGEAVIEMRFAFSAIFLVIFIFAVVGLQLFNGKLRACNLDGEIVPVDEGSCSFVATVTNFTNATTNATVLMNVTVETGREWLNNTPSFDNIFQSFFSLFVVLTLELWTVIMYRAMDYAGPGEAPETNASSWSAIFFLTFAVVGGFIMVNIFMSVLVDCYNRSKRNVTAQRSLKLTREQNGWMGSNRRLLRALPKEAHESLLVASPTAALGSFMQSNLKKMGGGNSKSAAAAGKIFDGMNSGARAFRNRVRKVLDTAWFQNLCYLVIFASFLALAIDHYPAPDDWEQGMFIVQEVFTGLFALEAALKIFGEGFTMYFASNWNRFDFFVVVISILSVSVRTYVNTRLDAIFRSLRILRLARIFRGKSSLSDLVHKFGMAAMNLGGVGAIIFIFFYMFAVMGIELFGRVHWDSHAGTAGISHMSNFSNIGHSLFMLFRITFGGDWWFVWWAVRPDYAGCTPELGDCGPPDPISQLYFVIFIGFSSFVLKNLLVAVLVDQFSSAGDLRALAKPTAKLFIDAWIRFDPDLTMRVTGFDVLPIIRSLPKKAPIGFNRVVRKRRIGMELKMLYYLKIRDPHARCVSFETVVDMLCHMAYEAPPPDDRPFQMEAPDYDLEDEEARFSAILIVINQVAQRLISRRRQKKAAAAVADEEAEMSSLNGNASMAAPLMGRGSSDAASRGTGSGGSFLHNSSSGGSGPAYHSPTFAEQVFGDPDMMDFDDSDDEMPILPPQPHHVNTTSSALAETRRHAVAHRNAYDQPPDFDSSDSDDDMRPNNGQLFPDFDVSDDDDEEDEDVTPFYKQVRREAKKSVQNVTQTLGSGVTAVGRTSFGRSVSMIGKKSAGAAATAAGAIATVATAPIRRVRDVVDERILSRHSSSLAPGSTEEELREYTPPPFDDEGSFVMLVPDADSSGRQFGAGSPPYQPPPTRAAVPAAAAGQDLPRQSSSAVLSPSGSMGGGKRVKHAPPKFLGTASPKRMQPPQRVMARSDTPPPEDDPDHHDEDAMNNLLMLRKHV